jgi:hypothetical protein
MKKKKAVAPKSNYTRNSIIFLLVVAGTVAIWGVVCNLKYWKSYELYPAQITRIYQTYRGKYNLMWRVEYQYTVDGKTYKDDEEFFNKSDYGDRQVGDSITIEVSSNNSEVSRWKPKNEMQKHHHHQ